MAAPPPPPPPPPPPLALTPLKAQTGQSSQAPVAGGPTLAEQIKMAEEFKSSASPRVPLMKKSDVLPRASPGLSFADQLRMATEAKLSKSAEQKPVTTKSSTSNAGLSDDESLPPPPPPPPIASISTIAAPLPSTPPPPTPFDTSSSQSETVKSSPPTPPPSPPHFSNISQSPPTPPLGLRPPPSMATEKTPSSSPKKRPAPPPTVSSSPTTSEGVTSLLVSNSKSVPHKHTPKPPDEPATLDQACAKVAALEKFKNRLKYDTSPNIDAASIPISYEAVSDTAFVDKDAFASGVPSKFLEEAARQAKLDELLEEGNCYAVMLYTWRCVSLGIPTVKSQDQENRMDIHQSTVEVLEPEIKKLKQFHEFHERAAKQFCEEIQRICKDSSPFVSEAYLVMLGKLINMFAVLNELKNTKASVKNDFASYKKAADICKKLTDTSSITEAQKISLFLATYNSILSDVKDRIQKIAKHEDLLADVVNTCLQMYENNLYLQPSEKQGIVKVIGFSLFLIDSKDVNINTNKKLRLTKIDKIFKKMEAVPLFGDMMIGPFKYIEKTPNYDPEKWPQCNSVKDSTQKELLKVMPQLREEYVELMCDLATNGTNLQFYNSVWIKTQIPPGDNKMYYDLALRTLHTLSSWTARITEMFSWKLLHPTNNEENKACPVGAEDYEKATKYNYTAGEKCAITEVIAMIKSVQDCVLKMELQFTDCIYEHIYKELQTFIQLNLREPLRKSLKHKKEILKKTISGIRDVCADLLGENNPDKDLYKGKKDSESGYKVQIRNGKVPPSSTQLYMMRTMLESLVEKKEKKSMRKDLDPAHVTSIEAFLRTSFFWNYLINFSKSLHECCDLSQFWYREFYLEVAKKMQFPIEMSMPWILTDHILNTKNTSMMEYILFPMDLYNDSAFYALHVFKKQFLYEEIEAEVDLCFDQLIFKLSDQIFEHYKIMAGTIYLDRTFKEAIKKYGLESKIPKLPNTKYTTLLKQQHVSILGREADLNKLLGQRMNIAFVKALELAIARFESKEITAILELDGLLEVNRLAHRLLSQYLQLDSFEALFEEANSSVTAPYGKITLKIFYEVSVDLLPNYCYNDATKRYVKTTLSFVDKEEKAERQKEPSAAQYYFWGTKALAQYYNTIFKMYEKFVGLPHFDAMVKWTTYQDAALIFTELLNVVKVLITDVLMPYFKAMQQVFPDRCILPRFEMTAPGVLAYYHAHLEPIITYSDLQTSVFHKLRILGNAVLFFIHLEQALSRKEIQELKEANLFLNIIPKPHIEFKDDDTKEAKEEKLKSMMTKLQNKFKPCHITPIISKYGSEEQKGLTKGCELLTREKLCCGLSIFEMLLAKMKAFLDPKDPVWMGPPPPNGIIEVNHSKEFHRLWSAIQFAYCIPPGTQLTVEELFGEGLQWAGCVLMTLLGQHRRFQMLDFGYHLIKVHKNDMVDKVDKKKGGDSKAAGVPGLDVRKMVDRLRKFQTLNSQIFATLEKYTNRASSKDTNPFMFSANVTHFDPPKADKEVDCPTSPPTDSPGKRVLRDSIDLIEDDFQGQNNKRYSVA